MNSRKQISVYSDGAEQVKRVPEPLVGMRANNRFAAQRLTLATRRSDRLQGLLLTPASEALLLLAPCRDIHTFGMSYAIDVAFVNGSGVVIESYRDVLPKRRLREPHAVAVLERCAVPYAGWFERGDRLGLSALRAKDERLDEIVMKGGRR